MTDRRTEIYAELRALNLPAEAWALFSELRDLAPHPDVVAAEVRRAKDRERKQEERVSRETIPRNSTECTIIGKEKGKGDRGVGEGENQIPRNPRKILETVLDPGRASAILEHRQRLRAPLTMLAAELLAKRLATCPNPNAAADEMIVRGWKSIKPGWLNDQPKLRALPGGKLEFKPEPKPISNDDWKKTRDMCS